MGTASEHERRRHRRLELAFPVRFSGGAGAGGGPPRSGGLEGQGLTIDISSGGVRFETDLAEPPAPDSEVALQIAVPRHAEGSDGAVFLSGRATVVRCERLDRASRHHTGARWALAARFRQQPEISIPVMEDLSQGRC